MNSLSEPIVNKLDAHDFFGARMAYTTEKVDTHPHTHLLHAEQVAPLEVRLGVDLP